MIAKLMKLLSGVAALAGRRRPVESDDLAVLTTNRSQLNTNVELIREMRVLRGRLRQMESMSDADRGNEHAAELDRVKDILHDRHGINVSRMQIASAVQDLSERLDAAGVATRKLEASAWDWNAAADAAW